MNIEHLLTQLLGRRESAFETQLHTLRREVKRLGHSVSRQAGHTAHDWSDNLVDLGQEAAKRGAQLAEMATYQAGRGAKAMRNDPLPVLAVLGTALLAARLFSRR